MIILDLLKKVLQIGAVTLPKIAAVYSPPLGMLVDTIFSAILHAESSGKKGDEKREIASLGIQIAGPMLAKYFEQNGKGIKNPELFSSGVLKIQEGLVDVLNSTGENTK